MVNIIFVNPITSSFSKYYELTKSKYSRDVDHLVTVNNNGLWIKENLGKNGIRIIHAKKLEQNKLLDLKILTLR